MYFFFNNEVHIRSQVSLCLTFHFKGVNCLSNTYVIPLPYKLALSHNSFDIRDSCFHSYNSQAYSITP